MANTQNRPVFGYWNIRGYGHPIRFMLKYLEVDYVEKTYDCNDGAEWTKNDKNSLGLDFPNLPYWIDGDLKMSESRAIIKHVAREYSKSLLPQTAEAQRRADTLDGVVSDIWRTLLNVCLVNNPEAAPYYDSSVPEKLHLVVKYIGGEKWCLGNEISYLDFLFYEILYHNVTYKPNLLDELPTLKEYMKNFEAIPSIAKYMNSSEFIKAPCFGPWAKIKL